MRQKKSILRKILFPICILLLVQVILLFCGIEFLGFFRKIDDNAFTNLQKNVKSQGDELEEDMVVRWSNLNIIESRLNDIYRSEKDYNKFLKKAMPRLISTLRTNKVNGVYVVLTDGNFDTREQAVSFPGIYLEDQDLTSSYNQENKDLLLFRAPTDVAKSSGISTRPGWGPTFQFEQNETVADFITKPIDAMKENKNLTSEYAKYWGKPIQLKGTNQSVITCSIPLVDDNGKIYGVVGVSVNEDYLQRTFSNDDLAIGDESIYRVANINKNTVTKLWDSGSDFVSNQIGDEYKFKIKDGFQEISMKIGKSAYGYSEKLHIYEKESPFAKEEWSIVGIVPKTTLLTLTSQTKILLIGILAFVFITSFLVIFLIAKQVAKPVIMLTKDVEQAKVGENIHIEQTGVYELDFLSKAIENLSREAYISAGTFTRILKMSSLKIGGFEYDQKIHRFTITNQFFDVFGKSDLDETIQEWEQFQKVMKEFDQYKISHMNNQGYEETEYEFVTQHTHLWVRMKSMEREGRHFGLVEDITQEKLQIQRVEYERDHDVLTNLLNRRAFHAVTGRLFTKEKEKLKVAAIMMLDLDNLKYVNDNFGHDAGDNYIMCMADHLESCVNEGTLISRMSGDEFYVFFYGYDNKSDIRSQIYRIYTQMKEKSIRLPNGENHTIRASAGIAWYPSDAVDFADLLLYADFAMYKVKNNVKGAFAEFQKETYEREAYLLQNKESLHKMLSKELVDFHYQPIIDVKNGTTYGYEALIRPQIKELKNIEAMLKLARMEGMMQRVETLSLFKSMEIFKERSKDLKNQECKIFINSISDQKMTTKNADVFTSLYEEYLHRIVLEITEVAEINDQLYNKKRKRVGDWGAQVALDDFGSGYNGDVALLKISPDIVKVDIGIISGIDQDADKQLVVQHLIEYAKQRNIKVLAEGVETKEEYDKVLELGVDFVQGFYIARPKAELVEIDLNSI